MNYFDGVKTESELKTRFRELARSNHPDLGGCTETMKEINAEYDSILERLLKGQDFFGSNLEDKLNLDKELRAKVEEIAALEGLNIEICGTWLWVTGETREHKETLKSLGFKWARKKKSWYFHTGEYSKRGKKVYSLDEIRSSHGSINVNRNNFKRAAIA